MGVAYPEPCCLRSHLSLGGGDADTGGGGQSGWAADGSSDAFPRGSRTQEALGLGEEFFFVFFFKQGERKPWPVCSSQ